MCIELYKRGELDEDLIPVKPGSDFKPPADWWPHWDITEDLKRKAQRKGDRLGSSKQTCLYFSQVGISIESFLIKEIHPVSLKRFLCNCVNVMVRNG